MIRIILTAAFLLLPCAVQAQDIDMVPQSQTQITLSYSPIVKKVAPAVVNIYSKRIVTQMTNPFMRDPFFAQLFGGQNFGIPRQRLENSLGSGVIVDPSGLVVTNAHVVKNADETKVMLSDGREFDARIALVDDASDIALLRIDTKGEKLPTAPLQPSETMEVGDLVIAIGNPFGVGQTVTSGIVSALARSTLDISDFNFFIQTDAAINPGNSGGPLVSMTGGVVGINSAIYSRDGGSLGIGFAIPSEMVATIIAAEKAGQADGTQGVRRPWVGITVQDVTADIASSLGLPRPAGALVSALHAASPAREAGLQQGDIITAVNGKSVRDGAELRFRLAMVPIGQSAVLDYVRKGVPKKADMKAIAPPDTPHRDTTVIKGNNPLAGLTVENLNPAVAVELGLREDQGVVIKELAERNQLSNMLRRGDIITALNGNAISTVKDLVRTLDKKAGTWSIVLSHNGQQRQLVIR
jgi:serine protease Do